MTSIRVRVWAESPAVDSWGDQKASKQTGVGFLTLSGDNSAWILPSTVYKSGSMRKHGVTMSRSNTLLGSLASAIVEDETHLHAHASEDSLSPSRTEAAVGVEPAARRCRLAHKSAQDRMHHQQLPHIRRLPA